MKRLWYVYICDVYYLNCALSPFIVDHSFLGFEWQKRWCALSKGVFYYYGSDKGSIGVQLSQLLLHEGLGAIFHPPFLIQSKLKTDGERITENFKKL